MKILILTFLLSSLIICGLLASTNLTEEQMMLLIKEELEFTNELLQAQQITAQIITMKQQSLTKKTAQMQKDFERLKELANRDEILDEQSLLLAQSELKSLKLSTQSVGAEIDDFIKEMQTANDKRSSNNARLIVLSENIIALVRKDKSTPYPEELLAVMASNLDLMKTAHSKDSFDNAAFRDFVAAFGVYANYLERSGADISLVKIYAEQLRLIGQNIEEYNKQYQSFQQAMNEYQSMLKTQEEANIQLTEELSRINQYQEERFFRELIYFDSGSVELKNEFKQILKTFADEYREFKDSEFHIIGYSDSDPITGKLARTYPTNWELSMARATAVARYLIDKLDISASQIVITGRGEYMPFFKDGVIDKTKSRRVEIKIEKIK